LVQGSKKNLLERIRAAGVVGAGGGGFPTHVKYAAQVEVVIGNGAECEPLARVDQQRMASKPREVLRGLEIAMEITGAKHGIVALKKKYGPAISALGEAIKLGNLDGKIELRLLDDFYPAGDEFVLVREVLDRVIPEFGLPLAVGAVVSNVSSLIDVAAAVDSQRPVTHRYVSVAGAVERPATFRVPIGTPFSALLEAAGGAACKQAAVLSGGPMMGSIVDESFASVTKTTSLMLVLPVDHPQITRRQRTIERQIHLARSACLKCMLCTEICPRNLLGHRLYPDRLMRNMAVGVSEDLQAYTGAFLCSSCGLCTAYGCVMNLDPCAMNKELVLRLTDAGISRPQPAEVFAEREFGPLRRVPSKRLIARLGLADYDRPAPRASFEVRLSRLSIPLKQHAGAPARAVVERGQKVTAGDMLGEVSEGALGARVHTGLAGRVAEVSPMAVTIDVE